MAIRKSTHSKCQRGGGEKGTLLPCWEWKLEKMLLRKTDATKENSIKVPSKTKAKSCQMAQQSHSSACVEKTRTSEKEPRTCMFTAALLTTAKTRKHVHVHWQTEDKEDATDTHTMKCYSAAENETTPPAASFLSLGHLVHSFLSCQCRILVSICIRWWRHRFINHSLNFHAYLKLLLCLVLFYKRQTDCLSFPLFNVKYSFTVKPHCHRAYIPVCGRDYYASLNMHFLFFISHKTFSLTEENKTLWI